MTALRDLMIGASLIAALVVVAVWHAQDPDCQLWPVSAKAPPELKSPAAASLYSVGSIDWSADGRTMLSVSRGELNAQPVLTLHDVVQKSARMPIGRIEEAIGSAALAPDGRHLVVATIPGRLWWTDVESLESTMLLATPEPAKLMLTSAAIAADGRLVAAADNSGRIYVIDPVRRSSMELAPERTSSVCDLRFSHDGRRLAVARVNGSIDVWDLAARQSLQVLIGHSGPATAAVFLADGKRIMSAGHDDSIRLWDIASGREEWRGEFGLGGVSTMALSADKMTIAWGGFGRRIIVWDLLKRCKKFEIVTPASIVRNLKFSPDGTALAAAGTEETIRFYDAHSGREFEGITLKPDAG